MNEFPLEDKLCIISLPTIDLLLREENGSDLISLYMFYYATAKKQKTNQPYATNNFAKKGLRIGQQRFTKADKKLRELGLINRIVRRDKQGKITGWYIKLNYIWGKEAQERHIGDIDQNAKNSTLAKVGDIDQNAVCPLVDTPTSGFQNTNALSGNNINASNVNNINASNVNNKNTFNENSIEYRLSYYLFSLILGNDPKYRQPDFQKWAKQIDLMIRMDQRYPEEIRSIIAFSQQDEFWKTNILSTDKLRKQYTKLLLKVKGQNGKRGQTITNETVNRIANAASGVSHNEGNHRDRP